MLGTFAAKFFMCDKLHGQGDERSLVFVVSHFSGEGIERINTFHSCVIFKS